MVNAAIDRNRCGMLYLWSYRLGGLKIRAGCALYRIAAGPPCLQHTPPKHQASTAFWAWMRFSASSNTRECGPSITASVTSSPR